MNSRFCFWESCLWPSITTWQLVEIVRWVRLLSPTGFVFWGAFLVEISKKSAHLIFQFSLVLHQANVYIRRAQRVTRRNRCLLPIVDVDYVPGDTSYLSNSVDMDNIHPNLSKAIQIHLNPPKPIQIHPYPFRRG